MKKIVILAVVAALIGISLPQSVSAQSSSSSSTMQDDQQGVQGTQGTSGSQGTTGTGTSGTGTGTTGTGTGTSGSSTGTSSSSYGTGTSGSSSSYSTEVKTSELPMAVSRAISEKYPGYRTDKVFKSAEGNYKVTLSKDDEKQTIFLNEKGESVKMNK